MTPADGADGKLLPLAVRRLVQDALPPEALAVLSGPVGAAVAQAAGYAGRALSDNTRRAYESDWRAFCGWCEAGGISPLPAAPVVVAGHLASPAKTLGHSGLRWRLAAIAQQHRPAGHPWEMGHPAISTASRGILATRGKTARPAAALNSIEMKRLLASCGTGRCCC
ncbi:hypothetical protein [Roseomonas indoligenes]|uniref:Integrase n=1 Tax=Roseomonas indoligenes TaxID=2820811 RepID=A0A940MXF4_9PROT|nr:hypothetical protein [Pararoseomonas indoligenes]MBP0496038.1 hypothetical protein [Pararoseomonas indoligenes]